MFWYSLCLSSHDLSCYYKYNIMKPSYMPALITCFLFSVCYMMKANDITQNYIEQYKSIAINEMKRVGIPASIKMAQAILESNSGSSTLARQSNNHFGIKCGSNWTGKEVYREDDDYNNGLLIRSCFRAFEDPVESFYAHSDFLANPNTSRYKSLFELSPYDYKAWAHGLRKAGYATDPQYPAKLISLIEKHELYLLDSALDDPSMPLVINQPRKDAAQDRQRGSITTVASETSSAMASTPTQLHRTYSDYHKVAANDHMASIAALYDMPVQELYIRNRLPNGAQPVVGELLSINDYIHFSKIPKYHHPSDTDADQVYLWEESMTIGSDD